MKFKKIVFFSLILIFFTACEVSNKEEKITIFIDENSEYWVSSVNAQGVVEDERIEEINLQLKELNKNYQIEIRTVSNNLSSKKIIHDEIKTLKKIENEGADIVLFSLNTPVTNFFEPLDKYMKKENGKKLREEIPDHFFEANKINGKSYYIPKISMVFQQFYTSFETGFYNANKQLIDMNGYDSKLLLENLINHYQMGENEVLFNNASPNVILWRDYESVRGTPLLIRREDRKIINPLEEESVIDIYNLIIKANLEGFLGKNFTQDEWNEFYEDGKTMVYFSENYWDETDIYGNYLNEGRVNVYDEKKIPTVASGFGILKNSKHKENAFDFLCEMNTNSKIANLLIYGKNPSLDQNNRTIVDKGYFEGIYFGSLGNDLITDTNLFQKDNKKEIVFRSDKKANMELFIPSIFDLTDMAQSIDQINEIWYDFSSITVTYDSINLPFSTIEETKELFEKENKKLKKADIDKVISELQKQLDER